MYPLNPPGPAGGGTLGIFGWGCAARTLEPLAYTRARSSEFLPPYTRLNYQNSPYPRVAVFQKLLRSQTQFSQNKTDLIFSYFWVSIPGFPSLDQNLQPIDQFPGKWYPILDLNSLIYIPCPRINCLKSIPFTAAHTYVAHIWQLPPPWAFKSIHFWSWKALAHYTSYSQTSMCDHLQKCQSKTLAKLSQSKNDSWNL